jgi:hypothetical protein
VETSELSAGQDFVLAGWLSYMSKALPKNGSAWTRVQVSNTRLIRVIAS